MGSKRTVWVSVGKTHHQAWLVEGVVDPHTSQDMNQACNEEKVLIQWESVRYTEWVPRSSVHFEIPSLRRRPEKKFENRSRSNTQQADFVLTKNADCTHQHSDMSAFMAAHRPQPVKTPLNQEETCHDAGVAGTEEEKLITNTRRVLQFSKVTEQPDSSTNDSRPKQMESSCQLRTCATMEAHNQSMVAETYQEPKEPQASTAFMRRAPYTANDFRKENLMEKNTHKSRQNIKFKSKHKSFTLRDLEQDGNFTETQLRVFNELLTGKTLFSPPSLKKLRRTLSCAKRNQKSFLLSHKNGRKTTSVNGKKDEMEYVGGSTRSSWQPIGVDC